MKRGDAAGMPNVVTDEMLGHFVVLGGWGEVVRAVATG